MKVNNQIQLNQVNTSYILCLAGFFGVSGLHRIYNGKLLTGILWFCTFGLCGVGQFVDLFLIREMVEQHNAKLRAKHGLSPTGVPLGERAIAEQVVDRTPLEPTREQLKVKLLKAAQARSGKLSVTQGVMELEVDFAEVESLLQEMVKSGYATVGNDPDTGIVLYEFHEL